MVSLFVRFALCKHKRASTNANYTGIKSSFMRKRYIFRENVDISLLYV